LKDFRSLILIFPLAITLHNIEEALWLPQWSQFAKRYHKRVGRNEFYFALICVTLIAYLSSFFFLLFNEVVILKYIYFGFVGAMILNAIFPHLIATIVLKRYAPGVITGILMNVPCFSSLIIFAIKENVISTFEVIISTVVVGGTILASLPIFFKLGQRLTMFEQD
jgi:drug/metabolite transporter (DMT)-like permease